MRLLRNDNRPEHRSYDAGSNMLYGKTDVRTGIEADAEKSPRRRIISIVFAMASTHRHASGARAGRARAGPMHGLFATVFEEGLRLLFKLYFGLVHRARVDGPGARSPGGGQAHRDRQPRLPHRRPVCLDVSQAAAQDRRGPDGGRKAPLPSFRPQHSHHRDRFGEPLRPEGRRPPRGGGRAPPHLPGGPQDLDRQPHEDL